MKRILPLLAACLLSSLTMAAGSSNPSLLQFRLVEDNPAADSEPMTLIEPRPPSAPPVVLNVQKTVLLDQTAVRHATATDGHLGQPFVNIEFTDDGAKQFAAVTRDNIGNRLAIVINGKLYSAPRINSEISGGKAEITGSFTKQDAQNLAARLNGSPIGEGRTGSNHVFFVIAALFVVALGSATWIAVRGGRPPKAA